MNDVISSAALGGFAVGGTLQAGTLRLGQTLRLPAGEVITVKALHSRNQPTTQVTAGDHVEVGLAGVPDVHGIEVGTVLSDPASPARLVSKVEVTLRTLQPPAPLTKGQPFEMYCHAAAVCVTLRKIVCALDKQGRRAAGRPRALLPGSGAVVKLALERPICVERHVDCRPLGKFVLREGGRTLAVGVITALLR